MSAIRDVEGPVESGGVVHVFRVVWARWWVVLVATVVCVVVAFVLTKGATKQYTAVAKLNFGQNQLVGEVGGVETVSADPSADQATNLQVVTTTPIAAAVIQRLGLKTSPSDLLGEVSTAIDSASNIVDISVVDTDPASAARIADAFANEYVTLSRAQNVADIKSGETLLNQQLAALPKGSADSDTRTNLLQSLQKLETLAAVQTGNASVVDYATVPGSPSSPNSKVNLLVALVFGVLLGVGIAFLLDLLDRRLKAVEDFEELYGTRALATVPFAGPDPGRTNALDSAAVFEQFLILRTGLSVLTPRKDPQVVLVTSAIPGEGKTTIAIGLARAAASSGQNVILVEADVRRPQLGARLDIMGRSPGLTPTLMRDIPMEGVLASSVRGMPRLRVIMAGPPVPNPVALLGSSEMGLLLERLAERADLVVVDAPPLLPVADADALVDHSQVDAFLVVGRADLTTRDDVRAVRRRLARRDLTKMGLVINGVRHVAGGDAYYESGSVPPSDGVEKDDTNSRQGVALRSWE
jgi:succinoglycan biosynthesis transport protein ExoP